MEQAIMTLAIVVLVLATLSRSKIESNEIETLYENQDTLSQKLKSIGMYQSEIRNDLRQINDRLAYEDSDETVFIGKQLTGSRYHRSEDCIHGTAIEAPISWVYNIPHKSFKPCQKCAKDFEV